MHAAVCNLETKLDDANDRATEANAPISDAILRSQTRSPSVYLLEYSRSPQSFRNCLLKCPSLEQCRKALRDHGFDTELPSGAKLFVLPEHVELVMQTLADEGWELKPRHIIVSDEFEDAVVRAIESLRSSERVKQKCRKNLTEPSQSSGEVYQDDPEEGTHAGGDRTPEWFAKPAHSSRDVDAGDTDERTRGGALNTDGNVTPEGIPVVFPYLVKRTFLHIPFPSSLWSGPTSGQKTASTTDAQPQKGENPRQVRKTQQRIAALQKSER